MLLKKNTCEMFSVRTKRCLRYPKAAILVSEESKKKVGRVHVFLNSRGAVPSELPRSALVALTRVTPDWSAEFTMLDKK